MSASLDDLMSMSISAPTAMRCPRCERPVFIPAKHGIRLPANDPPHCHEIVNLRTGAVHSKGDPR